VTLYGLHINLHSLALALKEYRLVGYNVPCRPLEVNRRFGGTYRLFVTCYRLFVTCFHTIFLLGLFFDPEDGGDMFLRNTS
jgi:hypothetical protein